ncbi:MAG: monovalent cation/H(+) antiporter subunit G [Pirellulaceae bacterium]|nr:monovalent cation/H(+) antiporter subunit G [Pirellulaceae bacterium]
MSWNEAVAAVLLVVGALFFLAGTLGVWRFPDAFTRLHAVTKADNLGLGLVVLGLVILGPSWQQAIKLVAVWLLVLTASSTASHLIARSALRGGLQPWSRR